jgi:hypothetical protein
MVFVQILEHGRPNEHDFVFPAGTDPNIQRWSGIWSSSPLDRPKRAMLRGVLNPYVLLPLLVDFPGLSDDLNWILDEADKIEETRNNAVHTALIWIGKHQAFEDIIAEHKIEVIPDVILSGKRAMSAAKKDLRERQILQEYRWGRDACLTLRDFANRIGHALIGLDTWPRRPGLPNRGQKKKPRSRQRQARPK